MKSKMRGLSYIIIVLMLFGLAIPSSRVSAATPPVSAIFGGGPFYQNGQAVMDDLKSSGFNTVMIWSIHVSATGDLSINDSPVCTNGTYVGAPAWKTQWATLKQAPTSVNRIEVSVGAWGCTDFENIKALINSQGTGSTTNLYKNFKVLLDATGADAIDYDDESCYDAASAVKFGQMCIGMGYKNVTLCPYTNSSFWSSVKTQLGNVVDRIYLQCYAGGASNNPSSWQSILGMKVIPGLWCTYDSASEVQSQMSSWYSSYGIDGGFMWLYDDMLKNNMSTASYASAINTACGGGVTPPTSTNLALNKTATANQYVTGETPSKAVDGLTSSNSKWCSTTSGDKWLKVDLGQNYSINRWVVKHAGAGGESTSWNTKDFKLQKSSDGNVWTDVDIVSGNTSSITDRNVSAFTSRYIRLYISTPSNTSDTAARIYEFEVYSDSGSQIQPPATPTGLATASPSSSQINVNWSPTSGATSYDLMIDGTTITNVTAPYAHTGLLPSSTHSYAVRAVNSAGASSWSQAVNGTTLPQSSSINVNLSAYFNEDGFSYDQNRKDGDLCGSYCYSADLATSAPTYDGITYQLGSFTDGAKNAINCSSQAIPLTQGTYSDIKILASSTNGDKTGTFRINYSDGTYTNVNLTLKDWCGSTSGQRVVETMTHRHKLANGTDDYINNYIFAYYLTPTSGKTVSSITLPNNTSMHLYAITLVQ